MTTPAYYKDGVPYNASGQVIITITGGPALNPGTNPGAPPVFVNWPGMGVSGGGGGGLVDYNPRNLPFSGLYNLREGQTKINQLLEQARKTYPQNAEQIKNEANALLTDLRDSGLINHPELSPAANALLDAVSSLQINIDLKNLGEQTAYLKAQDTENTFRNFMNNNKLSNFIDKPADMTDIAIATSPWLHKPWDNTVMPKFSAEIEEKNKLVTYLDRIKTIAEDVVNKKNGLVEVKNRVEPEVVAEKVKDEKEALTKTSELIVDMGDKIGEHLSVKYKMIAREIADDIKNFQGKTLRNYNDAMASLNKIISNPGLKINQADNDALIHAWKSLNTEDMANKLGNLSRAFKAVDIVMKVEKVREKSITGYKTGDWGPLVLEVESWVLSGVVAGVAIGILGSVVSTFLVAGSLPATIASIGGLMAIAYLASLIDASVAEKLNNEIIHFEH